MESGRFPATLEWPLVGGAICLVLVVWFFIGQGLAQAASIAPYSVIDNNISDLGSTTCGAITVLTYSAYTCSPWHVLMNATFVVAGLLTIVGMLATRSIWPRRLLASIGLALVVLSGFGEMLAGLAPEDVRPVRHVLASIVGIGFAGPGVLLLGLCILRTNPSVALPTVLFGAVALFGFLFAPSLGVPTGAAERMAGYPIPLWEIALGALLLWQHRKRVSLAARQ